MPNFYTNLTDKHAGFFNFSLRLYLASSDKKISFYGKISAQPHTFIMHTVLCLKKTMAVTIARICNLLALEKVYFF